MYLVKIMVQKSDIEGQGVFAAENIKKGSMIWKFDSEHDKSLPSSEFETLSADALEKLLRVAYYSSSSDSWIYPPEDDPARFTNHSERNNISAVRDTSISDEVFFVANRDISKGEEIMNNYKEFDERPALLLEKWL